VRYAKSARRSVALICALGTLAALTAVAAAAAAETPSATPAGGLTTVTIGLYPSTDYAALYVGMQKGIFKKYGLNIEVTQVDSGAALTADMVSGKAMMATNSVASMATAISNGLPLQLVEATDSVPTTGYVGVLVQKDSPIKSWKDLSGKTVATISLQGLFDLGVRNAIEKSGGSQKTMSSLAMDPTDEAPALQAGRVSAVVLQDPFLADALATGKFRSLGNPYGLLSYKMLSAGFYATKSSIAKYASAFKKFRTAFAQATKLVDANPSLARKAIPTYTALTASEAKTIGLPAYSTSVPVASINKMTAQMKSLGWIKSEPSYTQQVWNGK
jgi:NitT/TauT family transport system substrate-binding protein